VYSCERGTAKVKREQKDPDTGILNEIKTESIAAGSTRAWNESFFWWRVCRKGTPDPIAQEKTDWIIKTSRIKQQKSWAALKGYGITPDPG